MQSYLQLCGGESSRYERSTGCLAAYSCVGAGRADSDFTCSYHHGWKRAMGHVTRVAPFGWASCGSRGSAKRDRGGAAAGHSYADVVRAFIRQLEAACAGSERNSPPASRVPAHRNHALPGRRCAAKRDRPARPDSGDAAPGNRRCGSRDGPWQAATYLLSLPWLYICYMFISPHFYPLCLLFLYLCAFG